MCTTNATRKQSIGASSANMHSTAAQLQIYTKINIVWLDPKAKGQTAFGVILSQRKYSCKANATTLEKNKDIEGFRHSRQGVKTKNQYISL